MILRTVSVLGFRSIREQQDLQIDQFVTVLIGANDHGKTNLLQAIEALNPSRKLVEADRNWDTDDEATPRIEWTFELTPVERSALVTMLEDKFKAEQDVAATDNANESDEPEGVPRPRSTEARSQKSRSAKQVETATATEKQEDEVDPLVTAEAVEAARNLETVFFEREGVGGSISVALPDVLVRDDVARMLHGVRPRVELFTGQTKIVNSITLNELEGPDHEFMRGIFRKAGIWDERASLFIINPKTRKRLDDASQVLTDRIREEWQQGRDLEFRLAHGGTDGDRIDIQIKDPAVSSQYVLPTDRSTGFSAFFGMSMALFARKEASRANNYIFVFDEPATALHPHGQVNVQRVFETLSQKNQLVFTTHSIFMVNKNYPTRNRAIAKTPQGTLIDHKPFIGNWKAVRSSLGLIFANNFFVADTTLLVEGPTDEIYVASLFRALDRLKVVDVDLNLFSIVDAGNSADMVAMAKLMADEGRRVVALVDGDGQGATTKKRLDALNKNFNAGPQRIDVAILENGMSIEDYALYPQLVREATVRAAKELVTAGIRSFAKGVKESNLMDLLAEDLAEAQNKNTTLGKALADASAKWFDDGAPLSKLQIARLYDEAVEALEPLPEPSKAEMARARGLAVGLITSLGLPEKAARKTIIEGNAPTVIV